MVTCVCWGSTAKWGGVGGKGAHRWCCRGEWIKCDARMSVNSNVCEFVRQAIEPVGWLAHDRAP